MEEFEMTKKLSYKIERERFLKGLLNPKIRENEILISDKNFDKALSGLYPDVNKKRKR